jgi:excisionase family DNA binding protein
LLDVNEAAKFTHLQPPTIRAWILSKRLPVVRLGRRVFIRRSKLEQLIRKSETPAVGLNG